MYIARYLLGGLVVLAAAAVAAIKWYPMMDFVHYVPQFLLGGTVALTVLTALALWKEGDLTDKGKTVFMSLLLLAVMIPSIYTVAAFIHESETSWSGGEIHWHADFEVILDGQEYDLIDKEEFCTAMSEESAYMCKVNDRIGTTKYHEHDDDRIHVEGVFRTYEEATLGAFFRTFDGELTNDHIKFLTNEGWEERANEDGKTLKIVVERGVGKRTWCLIGDAEQLNVDDSNICIDPHTADRATSPDNYVVTDQERDKLQESLIDKIFIIYDETAPQDALDDLAEDNTYSYNGETFTITKEGGRD